MSERNGVPDEDPNDEPQQPQAEAPGAETAGGTPEPEARPAKGGRLSRLRFKKKDIPGGLWLKCESCGRTIYRKELEEKGFVCPACDFHFTLPGAERIRMVLDEGSWDESFAELGSLDRLDFTDSISYADKIARTVEKTGQNEALLSGHGKIEGRPVIIAVLDFKFMGGSMGEVVGEKIALAADLARLEHLPLVVFTSSGGARMHEGMLSLMQMAKTSAALSSLNQAGGYSICVMTNPTTGGVTASFASVCDLTLAEPGALIGFAGPRVIASTIKQELPPGFQRAEFLLSKGQIDMIVDRREMRATLAQLIDYGTHAWADYPPAERDPAADSAAPAPDQESPRGPAPAPDTETTSEQATGTAEPAKDELLPAKRRSHPRPKLEEPGATRRKDS